jgi:hypothetical protein
LIFVIAEVGNPIKDFLYVFTLVGPPNSRKAENFTLEMANLTFYGGFYSIIV